MLAGAAAALLVASVAALFWPGVPMYDTVAQYKQVLGGPVDDWHPPIMVRLWQLPHGIPPGAAPMFVLQVALYAAGFALLVGSTGPDGAFALRTCRRRSSHSRRCCSAGKWPC